MEQPLGHSIRVRRRSNELRKYDQFAAACPAVIRRPKYLNRVGIRRGPKGDTIWVKVHLPYGGIWEGNSLSPGTSIEIKLGWASSVTWAEALARRNELQRRADHGQPLQDSQPATLRAWADDWVSRKKGLISGWKREELHLRKHLLPAFGDKLLDRLTVLDIEHWIAEKRAAGLRPGYIKRLMNTLKAVLSDAQRAGVLKENVASKVRPIRDTAARQRFLNAGEIVVLVAVAEKIAPWLRDAILWALHSGMRRGEIQQLCWQHIRELDTGIVVQLQNTKSGKPRSIICTTTMLEVLQRRAMERVPGEDRVWPIPPMTWRRRWERARAQAGLADVDFHDLRRTNATQAAAAGVDLRTLAARIGHSDLTMLEKHYAMVLGSAEREAAEKIEAMYAKITSSVVPLVATRR
jgi:integrase